MVFLALAPRQSTNPIVFPNQTSLYCQLSVSISSEIVKNFISGLVCLYVFAMFLPITSCIICGEHIAKIKYNLKSTYTEKSHILLIQLVEKIYKNVSFLHCNICSSCYDLLAELDTIQHRQKELYAQLKNHISKLEDGKSNNKEDISYFSPASNTSPSSNPEEDNIVTISDKEKEIKIDFSGLPIKIKRVSSKHDNAFDAAYKSKPLIYKRKTLDENEKAFERIQTFIQMDLSKHVEEHMNKCKPAKDVLCEVCGQNCTNKSSYEKHLKKHDDIKDDMRLLALNKSENNWFCEICGKNFSKKGALARHLPIHTGETRYQCEACGKRFLHHSSFNMHRKIHKGWRNFKCETCNHCFLTSSHLKRHRRSTHDREKKHVCELCGKQFTENYNLIAHMKGVHKEMEDTEQLPDEEQAAVYYVEEEVLVKDDTLIHMNESATTVLYNL